MLQVAEFKKILKKHKNVFLDILDNISIVNIKDNIITFMDDDGNKIIAELGINDISFTNGDKRRTKVIMPVNDDSDIEVIDIIKEEGTKGCVVEKIRRYYGYTRESTDQKVLVDLISKRYVFDMDVTPNNLDPWDEFVNNLSIMETTFECHLRTLKKSPYETRYTNVTSPCFSITLVNGKNISHVYDIVNGIDKIYRIYDLYNGVINERNSNDIYAIYLGLLRKDGFGYKELNGITQKENEICGDVTKVISDSDARFINDFIRDRIGYKDSVDIYDINSIINAITYQNELDKSFLKTDDGLSNEKVSLVKKIGRLIKNKF